MIDPRSGGSWLVRISVGRPVTVLMAFLALLLLGAVAVSKLPVQLMPSGFDPPFMMVRVPYPGANPAEVEEKIVRPLEDALYTVRGIQELNCRAASDSARCWVEFSQAVDMETTYNEVADRIERLRATAWPDDVERVWIRRFNPSDDASLVVGLPVPEGLDDPYWVLQHEVAARIERVAGVAQVDLEGVDERQIFIEPDRDALATHRVSLWDLVQSLRSANFAISSGDVRDGSRELLVRSVARFRSLAEIENLPIRPDGLRIRDVGRVRFDTPPIDRISRLDGGPAAMFEIFKESEANTVAVTQAVRAELDAIEADDPQLAAGGGFRVLFDQGEVIQGSIRQLRDTGLFGGFLAVVILYLFLRRIRVTLLITLAIPASLLTALVVMYFAGESVNLVSLMGLIICTGMLVDNAVVVADNIDRKRREGLAPPRAALDGASEMAMALTLATLTNIIVFIPMVVMSDQGMMRFFLTRMAIPVVVSIGASLLVALLFLPLAAALLLRSEAASAERGAPRLARAAEWLYHRTLDPVYRVYQRSLEFFLRRRPAALAVVGVTLAVTAAVPMQGVEMAIQGRHQQGGRQLRFFFNLPNSYGFKETDAWFRQIEGIVEGVRDEYDVRHVQTRFWRNRGRVQILLEDADRSDVTVEQAAAGIRALIPETPGVEIWLNWQRGSGNDPSVTVTLYGEDTPTLADLADEAERRLRVLPELVSVEPDLEQASEEVRIRINREQALRYGVRPEIVSGTVSSALRGVRLPRYRQGEKEIEILVQFPEEDREGLARLASLDLGARSGSRIPLEALADINVTRGYGEIARTDRRTSFSIKLNTTRASLASVRKNVTTVMNGLELPRGYSWDFGSAMRWERRENQNFLFGLAVAIVFIYLIMGFLFESVLLPLAVMPSIVLSWVGVWWLLWATDTKLDMMAAIGLVLLAGVVVNNGIILVDLINRLRCSGMSRTDAILEAGRLRFRPILMTSATTIMGMLPMAIGQANFVGIPFSGLGKTFVGGLLSSTTLTLVVVPVFYTILDDAGSALRLLLTGRRASEPAR